MQLQKDKVAILKKREIIHLQLEDTIVRWNINKQKISEREAGGTASLL